MLPNMKNPSNTPRGAKESNDTKEDKEQKIIPVDISLIEQGLDVDRKIIMLEGPIDHRSASFVGRAILLFNLIKPEQPITLIIDSTGGDVYSALAIYDQIKCSVAPVITIGKRVVMSAAVLLLAAGEKSFRYIYPNTTVMIHGGSMGLQGKGIDVEDSLIHFKDIENRFNVYLNECSKMKLKELDKISASGRDFYYTAEQAVDLGVVDAIIMPSKEIKKLSKKTKKDQKKLKQNDDQAK